MTDAASPPSGRRTGAAYAALILFTLVSLWLAIAPAVAGSRVVLATAGGSPDWLIGVFSFAGADWLSGPHAWAYYLVLMLAAALWGLVVWLAPRLDAAWIWGAIIGLHAVFLLGPPLLSQDVFSYIAYARLGVEHGLNPYAFRPFDIPGDPVFGFAGSKDAVNVYGPFFTLLTYPLAWLSVPTAFWILKTVAVGASLGLVWLVRGVAERVGAQSTRAIAIVGLCPATLVHVVGGAHNEALVMLVVFAGIALALSRPDGSRDGAGGFVSALAIGIKASAAVPLPFMLAAARERWKMLSGMIAAGVLTLLTALLAFGSDSTGALNLISSNQDRSSRWSLPHRTVDGLDLVFGSVDRATATDVVRGLFVVLLAVAVAWLLWRSYKRPETWLANAGWATLGVLLASAWLVPWYLLWLLPFAAVGRDRALQIASALLAAYTLVIAIPF